MLDLLNDLWLCKVLFVQTILINLKKKHEQNTERTKVKYFEC